MESINPEDIQLIGDYLSKALKINYSLIIPAWQGFLISCTLPKGGRAVFWLHARTIDGLFSKYGIFEQTALQAANFVLAYVPGGKFVSSTVRGQLGEPPQANQTFLPEVHSLEYGSFEVSRDGQLGAVIDLLSISSHALVSGLTRATQTLHKTVLNVVGKKKSQVRNNQNQKAAKSFPFDQQTRVGYTIVRFRSRFEELRTQKIEEEKIKSQSDIMKIVKGFQAQIEPSGQTKPSFKVFNPEDAKRFLRQARDDGFNLSFLGAKIV
ncbi:MAG: hypothetical protein ACFFB3_09515 [Candidatus Hodarchaeota archaeon]